jgi:hypothetical protein
MDDAMQSALRALGDNSKARNALLVESIHTAGPDQYQDYQLIERGAAQYAGRTMGQIVYQGQNPGKGLRWFRVLIDAGHAPDEPTLMLVHSTPLGRQNEFKPDFGYIEQTWEW